MGVARDGASAVLEGSSKLPRDLGFPSGLPHHAGGILSAMEMRNAWMAVTVMASLQVGGAVSEESVASLRFELREQYQIVVSGAIGPLERLNLLIDTGSIPSMVDRRVVRKLGVNVQKSEIVAFGEKSGFRPRCCQLSAPAHYTPRRSRLASETCPFCMAWTPSSG